MDSDRTRLNLLTKKDTDSQTHYRCGGNLIPMPKPMWSGQSPFSPNQHNQFARCDRCHLPGEVIWVNAQT